MKSSEETIDAIERGWRLVGQKEMRPGLRRALHKQQELCSVLIQDKKKLINQLQQVTLLLTGSFKTHLLMSNYNKVNITFFFVILDFITSLHCAEQELKLGDDCYVKDLRKNKEEIDQMIDRMEDQIKTQTQTYWKEMAQIMVRPGLDQQFGGCLSG